MFGCIHGRFQPFHLGHLEYALRAYPLVTRLYVGISNSDPGHISPDASAPHRHHESSNPLPYFHRLEMVSGALLESGVDPLRLRVVPFPINRPDMIRVYVPKDAIHYVSVFDEWGERKTRILESIGLQVVPWRDMNKVTSGTIIRERFARGEDIAQLVPPFVLRYLGDLGLNIQD